MVLSPAVAKPLVNNSSPHAANLNSREIILSNSTKTGVLDDG